jgi:hypothetical protein
VPDACTLPTAEQPVRQAAFDDLFATALRGQHRLSPTRLRWELDPAVATDARELARRESACCSFFTFTFAADTTADADTEAGADAEAEADTGLRLDVEVPEPYVPVLDALAARAEAGLAR